MAINKRLGYNTQNWDVEPVEEVTVDVSTSTKEPNPGDIVMPKHTASMLPHPKHSGHMTAVPMYSEQTKKVLAKTNGQHALIYGDATFTTGIYVGQIHLNDSRKLRTGSHWSSTRTVKGLVRIFHVFLFGPHRVILDLNDVEILQHFDIADD
jgi:hypothetical protein